jgi:hypothetical protein
MGTSNSGPTSDENGELKPKKNGAFQISQEPLGDPPLPDPAAHKYETTREEIPEPPPITPAFENLGELPQSYGDDTLFLIARDPHWLFSYWDIHWAPWQAKALDGKFYLKLFTSGGSVELTTQIHPEAHNWYIPVKQAGASYYAEVGCLGADGEWISIARSDTAATPADTFSESAEADFATVPIHLTFQHLVEMVRGRMREGESLITALARLQGEGRRLLFQPGKTPEWTEEQRDILAALFGSEVMERISMGSGSIDQLLRQELLEKLSTESASELVSKSRIVELFGESRIAALLGPSESSLFSAYAAGGLGAGAFGSEVTSWLGAIGSSWSAQPFGQVVGREFFMHVNAEVIFYGGTHPDAKVWIDGKPVQLAPDGTFRFHFRFPDGNYSIPIVAESPDGVEQRSASLRFERATARQGDVGHTAQPGHLGAHPMGKG